MKETTEEFLDRGGQMGEKKLEIVQLKDENEPLWMIQQDMFIPLLVKALQELADKVDSLEKKIIDLENKP